jgi:hypothetical protein
LGVIVIPKSILKPQDYTTLFLFHKKKTCAKRKTMEIFLVKVFTEGKKVVGNAFL